MQMAELYRENDKLEGMVNRREMLTMLAAMPAALLASSTRGHAVSFPSPEEFLLQCAASISACWYLMTRDGLVNVSQQLPKYSSYLFDLAKQPSKYQEKASYFASQAYMLMGLIALHHLSVPESLKRRKSYCQQAVISARASGDITLLIAALTHLATACRDVGDLEQALYYNREAVYHMTCYQVSGRLQSKALAGLALSQARSGLIQDALSSIGAAQDVFVGDEEAAPAFLATDYGRFGLIQFTGFVRLDLATHRPEEGHQKEAEKALTKIDEMPTTIVPMRHAIEIANQRASVALAMRDLESFEQYFLVGADGAKALGSAKRKQEALTNWKQAMQLWPQETRIHNLADALI
ncbi:hypothetical protein EPA93_01680 [Ktedonosporobacter rubrisoli]|uniref:Tetratricopeptide repeat protein n=1 Tax=Ktedonosporobacter rubrisoli TaxID=2509675 RepID=A0A4P6JIN5_KTERU|nr:hypothetical protein [Ktedonosporobacter rubrisoli]QBD74770.1 hypothetical protein EPA93_01680 [Ktedonosporobacter rubrisoli]